MSRNILSPELQRIGKRLFMCPHKAGQLLVPPQVSHKFRKRNAGFQNSNPYLYKQLPVF